MMKKAIIFYILAIVLVIYVTSTNAVNVHKFSRKANEGLTLQASMDALSNTIDTDSFADGDDDDNQNTNNEEEDGNSNNVIPGITDDDNDNRTKAKHKALYAKMLKQVQKKILLQRLIRKMKASKTGGAATGNTGPTGLMAIPTGMTGAVGSGTGATGIYSTGPTGNFGDGETGATGSESGGTGLTGSGATGMKEEEEKETLFHSKVLTDKMVSIVEQLASNLTTDGSNLKSASKTFGKTAIVANVLIEKLMGKSNETLETLSSKYPLITAQCEKVKGAKILEKIRKGLFKDAAFVHEALVERLPKPVEIRDMVVETGSALKNSAEFIGNKPRCLGECAVEKSRIVAKENVEVKRLLKKVHIKCIEEEVQVENEFMKKLKADESKNEKSTEGLLQFSKLVVEMSDKVTAKEKRIAELRERLKELNEGVKKMDSSGGANAKLMLSNIRTKCLTEAADASQVELKHNKEELREVYNAQKVIFAMHQRHESLTRQYNMEFKRAPAFSDIKRCHHMLHNVKQKMYLPNPHSDHCLRCKGVMDINEKEHKAYCVWPRLNNHRCEEIAFLSGKCKAPEGLPKFCYDAILFGPKAIRNYLKKQGFPIFTPPRTMGTVVSKEEVADSHLGNATMSLNLPATSNLLRNEIDKMNDRLGEEEEDEDEELKKKHKIRKIIRRDDDDDETGATGISGASGISGISGASGITGATGFGTGATGATGLGLTDDEEGSSSSTGNTGMTGGPQSRVEATATANSGVSGATGAATSSTGSATLAVTSSTGSATGATTATGSGNTRSKTGVSGATGATAMNTGATGNNDIETGPTGLPSEKEVKIQEAKKELEEKSKAHQSLNEDENSNITI